MMSGPLLRPFLSDPPSIPVSKVHTHSRPAPAYLLLRLFDLHFSPLHRSALVGFRFSHLLLNSSQLIHLRFVRVLTVLVFPP